MEHTKYIIIEEAGCEVPVIFSTIISHDSFNWRNVVSAGFVDIDIETGEICCFGKSTSLEKEARPEKDAEIIRKELNRYKRDW